MTNRLYLAALPLLAIAVPATAQSSAQVPEASSVTLFALGALGVIVGRTLAKNRSDRDD